MTDMVNHPSHYKFSNGAEVIDISENLTSNAGQAVQYIARSSRIDGNNKGDVLEDLQKAAWFINREIERMTAVVGTQPTFEEVLDEATRPTADEDHGTMIFGMQVPPSTPPAPPTIRVTEVQGR